MGISRDSRHKRRATGGKRAAYRKKRKFELGRPAANTKIGEKRIRLVRTRGGNTKYRALRLETGNFSWGSEAITRKSRVMVVVYNASNNELVRTNTLVKNCIIQVDASPFRAWYEQHYGITLGKGRRATASAAAATTAAPAKKAGKGKAAAAPAKVAAKGTAATKKASAAKKAAPAAKKGDAAAAKKEAAAPAKPAKKEAAPKKEVAAKKDAAPAKAAPKKEGKKEAAPAAKKEAAPAGKKAAPAKDAKKPAAAAKKGSKAPAAAAAKKGAKKGATPAAAATAIKLTAKQIANQVGRTLDAHIQEQFNTGRLYVCVSSRPGQSGRVDGYVLEGRELEFYLKKIQKKKK